MPIAVRSQRPSSRLNFGARGRRSAPVPSGRSLKLASLARASPARSVPLALSFTAEGCIMKIAMQEVVVKPRDAMPEGARTLPARYYTDPALLKKELDGLFGTMWFYAGRGEEAAAPGQYFVRELNGYNIVVTRNASGE